MLRWLKSLAPKRSSKPLSFERKFAIEPLEKRHMLAVDFLPLHTTYESPAGKDLLIPLTSTESGNAAVSYSVTNVPSGVTATVVNSGTFLKISVSGKDSGNQDFTGDLTFQLFDSLTPNTVQRILQLVTQNFYNNLTFHRIAALNGGNNGMIVQGGDPDGNGSGGTGTKFDDEQNTTLTFNSPALLAMANSGPDSNDSQFFIVEGGNTLADSPQHLNFNHTIFGQLVSGFDVLDKMFGTPLNGSTPASPLTMTSVTAVTNNSDAVLRVRIPAGVTGNQNFTVTATSAGDGSTDSVPFTVNAVADTTNDSPFIADQPETVVTSQGTPITIQLTDIDTTDLTVNVVQLNGNSTSAATNVTFSFNATTKLLTITPNASFVGDTRLRVSVVETATAANSDLEDFTLQVNPRVRLSITPSNGQFGENGGTATVSASIDGTHSQAVTVPLNFSVIPGVDYSASAASITIPAGQLVGTVTLTGINDQISEGNESFTVTMGTIGGGLLADTNASRTTVNAVIVDDEALPVVTFNLPITTIAEDGPMTVTLTASINSPSVNSTIIPISFGGSATPGIDYNAPTLLIIPAGLTTGSLTITVIDDATVEGNEEITLAIGAGGITNGSFTGTFAPSITLLSDDDAPDSIILDPTTDDGVSSTDGYTSNPTPTLRVQAGAGQIVEFLINGQLAATAGDIGGGTYSATVPDGMMRVGTNTVVARVQGTTQTSSATTITYAPSNDNGYHVTGDVGATQNVSFGFTAGYAGFSNEIGVYVADDSLGRIGGVAVGAGGYAQAALASATRRVVFANGMPVGTSQVIQLTGGQVLGFYMVQNGTTDGFLQFNPTNRIPGAMELGGPVAFFSFDAANPDGIRHVQVVGDPLTGVTEYRWEDLVGGGDLDYNDVVFSVNPNAGGLQPTLETLRVPAGATAAVPTTFTLQAPQAPTGGSLLRRTFTSLSGEFGIYKVSDSSGTVNGLSPTDANYLATALATANRQTVFASGAAAGTSSTLNLTGSDLYGYYFVRGGTADTLLQSNPSNAATDAVFGLFSFDGANPDDADHFRWFGPENVNQGTSGQGAADDSRQLHVMDQLFGSEDDFDAFVVSIR